jgi:hypothetical protein
MTIERVSASESKLYVKEYFPEAHAFKWTGCWSVYGTPEMFGSMQVLLATDEDDEDKAWINAREYILSMYGKEAEL